MGEVTGDGVGMTMGLDLGDRYSHLCVLDEHGEVCEEGRIATTARAMRKRFEGMTRCLVVIEVGSHSPWAQRLLVMVTQMETCRCATTVTSVLERV